MQGWIPVASSSLYLWESVGLIFGQTVFWNQMGIWCMSQTSRDRDNSCRVSTHEKELKRNCSPIGHNNTKHFLCPIRSRHLLEFLEIVRWESVPRGSFARTWKLSSRLFSRSDWLPLGLRGWPVPGSEIVGSAELWKSEHAPIFARPTLSRLPHCLRAWKRLSSQPRM